MALLAVPLFASAAGNRLLAPDNNTDGWFLEAGGPIPAAELATMNAQRGPNRGIALNYAFRGKTNYVGIKRQDRFNQGMKSLSFQVDAPQGTHGVVRFRDASGQMHLARWKASGQKQDVTIAVPGDFDQHWGGANDGVIKYPLRAITFGVAKIGPQRGTVTFRDFRYGRVSEETVEEEAFPDAKAATLALATSAPSGVFFANEDKELLLTLVNREPRTENYRVKARFTFDDGETQNLNYQVRVPKRSTVEETLALDINEPGFAMVEVEVRGDKGTAGSLSHAISVVPRPQVDVPFEEAFFGVCFFDDMAAAKRMGAKFVRTLAHWKFIEMAPSQYYWEEVDSLLEGAEAHDLGVILSVVVREPPEWAPFDTPEGFNQPRHSLYLEQLVTKLAERLQAHRVDGAFEMQNEPDIALQWLNKMPLWLAGKTGASILEIGFRTLERVAPDVPVLGLGMSGMDFRAGLPLTEGIVKRANLTVDHFSPHPYTLDRYFDGNKKVEWPDSGYLEEYWDRMAAIAKRNSLSGELWSTELGWAMATDASLLSDESRKLAATVAQALVISKAHPKVKKFTWFTGQLEWLNEGYNYSLFRKASDAWYPTPAVNAFATTASLLEGARFVREINADPRVRMLLFGNPETERAIAVAWAKNRPVTAKGRGGFPFRIVDLYGRERPAGGSFTQRIGRSPVFFYTEAWKAEDMESKLRTVNFWPANDGQSF
ncbi:MAG: hypothetical protein ACFB21_11945 [Opitutales bacterium]